MDTFLGAVEAIGRAFAATPRLETDDALRAAGGDEALLCECLSFLTERDIVLFAADDRRLYHRPAVVEIVMRQAVESGECRPDHIAARTDLPTAIVCEALGWLERDGRVVVTPDADGITVRPR